MEARLNELRQGDNEHFLPTRPSARFISQSSHVGKAVTRKSFVQFQEEQQFDDLFIILEGQRQVRFDNGPAWGLKPSSTSPPAEDAKPSCRRAAKPVDPTAVGRARRRAAPPGLTRDGAPFPPSITRAWVVPARRRPSPSLHLPCNGLHSLMGFLLVDCLSEGYLFITGQFLLLGPLAIS